MKKKNNVPTEQSRDDIMGIVVKCKIEFPKRYSYKPETYMIGIINQIRQEHITEEEVRLAIKAFLEMEIYSIEYFRAILTGKHNDTVRRRKRQKEILGDISGDIY